MYMYNENLTRAKHQKTDLTDINTRRRIKDGVYCLSANRIQAKTHRQMSWEMSVFQVQYEACKEPHRCSTTIYNQREVVPLEYGGTLARWKTSPYKNTVRWCLDKHWIKRFQVSSLSSPVIVMVDTLKLLGEQLRMSRVVDKHRKLSQRVSRYMLGCNPFTAQESI